MANQMLTALRENYKDSCDFKERTAAAGGDGACASLFWLDSVASTSDLSDRILRPFTDPIRFKGVKDAAEAARLMLAGTVYNADAKLETDAAAVISSLADGHCALVFRDTQLALTFEVRTSERRGVEEPKEEKVIRGAKDAFTETIRTNTALIRRKLPSPQLVIEEVPNACPTGGKVRIVWQRGLTDETLVNEVRRRLALLDADAILTAAAIDRVLADRPRSLLPQTMSTERSDKFALNILEGRVGVIADGLPLGWLAPCPLEQFLRVPEDVSQHPVLASVTTILRWAALVLALVLPAFYVAVAMYHQEMLPVKLMQAIIKAKQSVPSPTAVETLTMLVSIDLLQEAGLRLPNPIGETISIIGALLVGQAAIDAKIVSPVVVIVVSLATIAGYTSPNQELGATLRIFRILLVLAAVAAGMMGVASALTLMVYYLCTLEVCGKPYTHPFSSGSFRAALTALTCRASAAAHPSNRTKEK